jgi:hypothetical protein
VRSSPSEPAPRANITKGLLKTDKELRLLKADYLKIMKKCESLRTTLNKNNVRIPILCVLSMKYLK